MTRRANQKLEKVMKIRYFVCAFAIMLFLVSCAPTGAVGVTDTPSGTVAGQASIDSVEIAILESFPVQVQAVVKGNLPDGCTQIKEATTTFADDTFHVNLTTERSADAVCTQALVPFEEIIPLDVAGLLKGDYTVDVNGVTETFELLTDNILGTAYPSLVQGETISWEEAQALFLSGEVVQVVQLHSLQVTLTLKDGRQVVTLEPSIDEVLRLIEACGEPCADLMVATE
jgi:inhibitor of cysteine peptidase